MCRRVCAFLYKSSMYIVQRQRENTMVIRVEEFAIRRRFTVDVKSVLADELLYS